MALRGAVAQLGLICSAVKRCFSVLLGNVIHPLEDGNSSPKNRFESSRLGKTVHPFFFKTTGNSNMKTQKCIRKWSWILSHIFHIFPLSAPFKQAPGSQDQMHRPYHHNTWHRCTWAILTEVTAWSQNTKCVDSRGSSEYHVKKLCTTIKSNHLSTTIKSRWFFRPLLRSLGSQTSPAPERSLDSRSCSNPWPRRGIGRRPVPQVS